MTFEDIRKQVIEELCKGKDLPGYYLEGVNDTLIIVKRMMEADGDDLK